MSTSCAVVLFVIGLVIKAQKATNIFIYVKKGPNGSILHAVFMNGNYFIDQQGSGQNMLVRFKFICVLETYQDSIGYIQTSKVFNPSGLVLGQPRKAASCYAAS